MAHRVVVRHAVMGGVAVVVVAAGGLSWVSLRYHFTASQNIALIAAVATVLGSVGSATSALLAFRAATESNEATRQLAELGERTAEALSRSYLGEFKMYVQLALTPDGTAPRSRIPFVGVWFGMAGRDYQQVIATAYGLDGAVVGRLGPVDFTVRSDMESAGGLPLPDQWKPIAGDGPSGEAVDISVAHQLLSHIIVEFDDQAHVGRWRQRHELVFTTPENPPLPGEAATWAELRRMYPEFVGRSTVL